jgi:hypothetical protein
LRLNASGAKEPKESGLKTWARQPIYFVRGAEVQTYHTIDLREIREDMGEHYQAFRAGSYKGYCDCGEQVEQTALDCPVCGTRIIWLGSKVWKNLWGNPAHMISSLTIRTPSDSAGQYLFSRAGLVGFSSQTDLKDWQTATRALSQREMLETIDYCYNSGSRGHGLVRHAINTVKKRGKERRDQRRRDKIKVDPMAGKRLPPRPK